MQSNRSNLGVLLRNCHGFVPRRGDAREDARLADALETLAAALVEAQVVGTDYQELQAPHSMVASLLGVSAVLSAGHQRLRADSL